MIHGFSSGFILLYVVLWIVIPKAKTPLQKLEMRGEKMTRERMEQTFLEEFQSRGNDPRNIRLRAKQGKNASLLSEIVSILGKILLGVLKIGLAFLGLIFLMVLLIVLWALFHRSAAVPGWLIGNSFLSPGLTALVFGLVIIVPLVLLVYGLFRLVFGFKRNKPLTTVLLATWILSLVFGAVIFMKEYERFQWDGNFPRWERHFSGWPRHSRHHSRAGEIFDHSEPYRHLLATDRLAFTADTLFVLPADSVRLPENFVVKIRKEQTEFSDSPLRIDTYFREKNNPKKPQFLESAAVTHQLRGDTLLLQIPASESSGMTGTIETELYLPEKITVVVDARINYNEYF
ncbi:MAG: hypothetical protein LUD68_01970 [Rikenellaceae bacterium]|nr:hypothetical protein [Rikenellaceae bacterium]